MGRRFRGRVERERPKHRINHHIRISPIRVIDADGELIGVMSNDEGRALAKERGLDLVEVNPKVRPPICKIIDYGKYKYEQKKATKKSSSPQVKTVQLRPKTDDHDLVTKLKRARKFLDQGHRVKLVMRMRGRERSYPGRWIEMMRAYVDDYLADIAAIAQRPQEQGRAIAMLLEPT